MSTITTSTANRNRKAAPSPHTAPTTSTLQNASATRSSTPALTHAQIAQRAYDIYRARNNAPGDQLSDWLQAERELRAGFHPTLR